MKKLMSIILVILSVSIFAANLQKINDVKQKPGEKGWYDYYGGPTYFFAELGERAVFYDVEDFGLEYPVNLSLITAYLYDAGISYTYKIYDKTMTTVIWESSPDSLSVVGYNDSYPANPIVLLDDFYVAMVPQADGLPRIIVDDGDGPYGCHSSYGTPGSMVSLYGSFDPLLPENNFLLGPWLDQNTDADIYPPIVRSFSGTDNFMGTDAPITIDVMDVAGVVTPIAGEYSLDGGAWTPFTLATAKSTSTLKGIIPGQADGTMGVARFTLVDSLGNSALSDEYPVNWSKDNTMLNESFEGEFPPANWTNALGPTGAGFIQANVLNGSPVHTGDYCLSHYYDAVENDDWFISPIVSIPAINSCTLTLWQNGAWMSYYDFHEISITTDGGANWTQIYTGSPTNDGMDIDTGIWEELKFLLTAYRGQDIQVGFHYQGNDSDEWFIDDVKITYDYQAPEIVKLEGNPYLMPEIAAYTYNDLVLNLTAYDLTGVKSITGHYSIDGGSVIDLPFTAAKGGEEIWTAAIPAEDSAITGTISFDLVDLGDISVASGSYDFQFYDHTPPSPPPTFDYGQPVFINNEMNLTLTCSDEAVLTECKGYYSEDDFVTSTPVDMTLSKISEYIFIGTLPAKTEETVAKVHFDVFNIYGDSARTVDYVVIWYDGAILFRDDFDALHNPSNWTFEGSWAVTDEDAVSSTHSLTDSPGGDYIADQNFSATINPPMDFTGCYSAEMSLWHKTDVEAGLDYVHVEGSRDGGTSWEKIESFSQDAGSWQEEHINLGAYVGEYSVIFRFRFISDVSVNQDGIYIDDIRIGKYKQDWNYTDIDYDGPEYPVVGTEEFAFDAYLTDQSGISETKVIYSVDGGPEQEVLAIPSSGVSGVYSYAIPVQTPMTKVDFRIVAIDASINLNYTETKTYEITFGNYLYYENGEEYIDYLDIIGSSSGASALAIAKRLTMGPLDTLETKDHYGADLVGFTIANYISVDYPSEDMEIHVWTDSGNGPGEDIITPFVQQQASVPGNTYAITYVDLRPYAAELSNIEGNVYVGFTSAGDQTCILYEAASLHTGDSNFVQYNRSWLADGSDIDNLYWSLSPDVYHMSGITGDYTLVDTPLAPIGLTAYPYNYNQDVILEWKQDFDNDLEYFNIYRSLTPEFPLDTPIGTVQATEENVYIDTNIVVHIGYYFKITAVDSTGLVSLPSEEVYFQYIGIEDQNIPLTTSLSQNYPNPFNPETTINFSTAVDAKVNLTVYNTAGEVVSKLVDNRMNMGYHNITFNASHLNSGVYYYTMEMNGVKKYTKKMVLIK
jgi:hypothetical protein